MNRILAMAEPSEMQMLLIVCASKWFSVSYKLELVTAVISKLNVCFSALPLQQTTKPKNRTHACAIVLSLCMYVCTVQQLECKYGNSNRCIE